jgi:hypothetical protein
MTDEKRRGTLTTQKLTFLPISEVFADAPVEDLGEGIGPTPRAPMTTEAANARQCICGQWFVPRNDRFRKRRRRYECVKERDPDESRALYVARKAKHPLSFSHVRERAQRDGFAFELSIERWRELQEQARTGRCEATGQPFDLDADEKRNPFFPSLDRIDSSKGYLDENVRVVVSAFNLMRGDLEDRTFHRIIVGYVKERRRRRELAEKGTGSMHPNAGAATAEREQDRAQARATSRGRGCDG